MRSLNRPALIGALVLLAAPPGGPTARADFRRGDVNFDGRPDVSDAVSLVRHLFRAGDAPPCDDAADANDDGKLGVDDAIALLGALFTGGDLPAPGLTGLGPDPTCDQVGCAASPDPTPPLVLNEISYNPAADLQLTESIEILNRSPAEVSLAGWRLTNGVAFELPGDVVLPPGGLAIICRDPSQPKWRRAPGLKLGPFEGSLSNEGERVTLEGGDCFKETVKYADRAPWPAGPDGGGPTLERIDPLVPADDFHAWRASTDRDGTPNEPNSTLGTPVRPVLSAWSFQPEHPTSHDEVTLEVLLDAPAQEILAVNALWEALAATVMAPVTTALELVRSDEGSSLYRSRLPAQASQTLVRAALRVDLASGQTVTLPEPLEPRPTIAYFVFDGELESKLPILWLFPKRKSGIFAASRLLSGAVVLDPAPAGGERPVPLVLDGTDLRTSTQGQKIRFAKGGEYRDYRTLNMVPEEGGGGTGLLAPHMEHFGFKVFRDLGAIAPLAEWYRVVDYASAPKRHTQRLLIEQVNERFLARNGLDPGGDLYKLDKSSFAKRTNPSTGLSTLAGLTAGLSRTDPVRRREAVLELLDTDSVGLYSVIGILMANWDGFHNNLYIYNELLPGSKWKAIPWDLDQVFEPTRFDFPVDFPLTGVSRTVSRETGPIARPFHLEPDLHAAYLEGLRTRVAPGGPFTVEVLIPQLEAVEKLLNDDLDLLEAYLGSPRNARRSQIRSAYVAMRRFVLDRVPYLRGELGE